MEKVFQDLFDGTSEELTDWRYQPGKWNMREIACHLYDEEREDFRTRLKLVLENPETSFPAIDPTGWVESRGYVKKDFIKTVEAFLAERKKSIDWLMSLENPKYSNAYIHTKFGPLSGKMLLANWLAHDYLHMRQIIKVKYEYLKLVSGEGLEYAGTW